ncbi:MAG: hypothetical protein Aureis2KO_23880 [Aureisphaera sp.]
MYDAVGTKLKKTVTEGSTTHTTKYANGYVYLDDELQFFSHAEGYVQPVANTTEEVKGFKQGQTTTSAYQYVFQYVDHLGNVRLSYADSDLNGSVGTSEIIEVSHYYPFGLKQKGYNTTISTQGNALAQNYKYNGKELNSELGMELYDFGARNYDASLGRWMNIDPLAEQMRRHSPYNYAFDNPIYYIDPDGMAPDTVIVNGDLADEAVEDLNASSNTLAISRDSETGELSAAIFSFGAAEVTAADMKLFEAINNPDIVVDLNATSDNFDEDGLAITGGTFGGSEVKDGVVIATQIVNPNQMEIIDRVAERGEGVGTLHEVLESYVGAEDSRGASKAVEGITNDAYTNAHNKADAIDPRHKADYSVTNTLVSNGNNVTVIRSISSGNRAENLVNQTMTRKKYNKLIRKSDRALKRLKKRSN